MSQLKLFGEIDHVQRICVALFDLAHTLSMGRRHVTDSRLADLYTDLAHMDRTVEEAVRPPLSVRFRETRPA